MAANTDDPWEYSTESPWNATGTEFPTRPPRLYRAYNITIGITVAFIMFAMGCGINWQVIKPHLKRPVGPIIGMICQLFLLPAICFGLAHAFGFEGELAIGMIIMGSAPGGAVSNIYSLWSRGDLGLSVTMTTFSTTLALGFVPLNMFIYSRSFTDEATTIPYLEMFLTVLYTWVAAVLGVIVGWKAPKVGGYISKAGSVVGFVMIIVSGVLQGQLYPEVFDLPWTVWFGAVIVPLIGYGIGNALAFAACLDVRQARTIGFETGMQNAAVAMTMITLSYDQQEAGLYVQYPLLYGAWMMVDGFIIMLIHQIYFWVSERRTICQKRKDARSRDLEALDASTSTGSRSRSSSSASSTAGSVKSVKGPVDLGKGKFKPVNGELKTGYSNGEVIKEKNGGFEKSDGDLWSAESTTRSASDFEPPDYEQVAYM